MTSRVSVRSISLGTPSRRRVRWIVGALRAAHLLDRFDERHVLGELVLDLDDLVAGLDAGAIRGRVLDRRDDGEHVVARGDLDAQAAEAAARVDLQLLVQIRRQIGAVRIERVEHAGDGAVDQLLRGDVVDVVLLHQGQHVGEDLDVVVGLLGDRRDPADRPAAEPQRRR